MSVWLRNRLNKGLWTYFYRLVADAELPICQRVSFAEGDRKKSKINKSFCLSPPANDTSWQIGNSASATSLFHLYPFVRKKAPSLYSLKLILLKKSFLLQKTGVKMKSIVQKIMIFRPNTFKINFKMYWIKSKTNFVKH